MTEAVVIGAGPNGLAAAIRLAEAGRSVLVCEAADHAGGALHSEQLTLPGFVHDVFSAVHPAGAASPVFARMPLHEHGLEWVHPEACAASPMPGGRAAVLYRSVQETARSLDGLHPGDGASWAAFVQPYLDAFPEIRDTMLSGFPPLAGPVKLLLRHGPVRLAGFSRLLPGTSQWLTRRLFAGSEARAWLHGAAMHGDAPPTAWGSAIAGFYLALLGHAVGWPSPRGGCGRFTDALVAHLRSLGGELRFGAPVVAVLSRDDRVTGVRLAGGETIDAGTVIADTTPHALLAMAGNAIGGLYREIVKRYHFGAATIKVDWALDGPIPWINEEIRRAGTVHLSGDETEILDAITQSYRTLPERPFLLLGQQSIADPTRAPAGKHTAWAYTHGPRRGVDYAAQTERHVERIEAQVERYAPGFRDLILARHVMSPADLQARNPNLVGGDVGGGSYAFRQVVFRPVPKLSPYSTPLRGLFIGSASAFPGGAVHGVPGDAAARASLRGRR